MNATKVSVDPVDRAARAFPQLQVFHFMDEGMSWLGKQEGRISGRNLARMINLIHNAEELDVDGILLSCTIFSPFIDQLRLCTDLPLVAADIGVFEKAARMYRKVGAVVSFAPTMESVAWVAERCRRLVNPELDVEIRFAEGAFEAAAAGDEETHNRIILETAGQFRDREAVILSQMSQVRALPLFENFPIPVLTSPSVSLGLLVEEIEKRKQQPE
ncbi:MAG: hypothetical protein IKF90_12090 [Parasporobacterium sp.]|nr:hypothetical protein [Parasporobacterium sp.]